MLRPGCAIGAALLLLAGCSADAIRTSQQAMAIALASDCATAQVPLMRGESMPTTWSVERKDSRWHVWLPPDPSGPDKEKGGWLKGAWINARDGQVDHCEVRFFGDAPRPTQTNAAN